MENLEEELQSARRLLSVPTNSGCNLRHENLERTRNGELVYKNYKDVRYVDYAPQCPTERMHFGCPHFLEQFHAKFEQILNEIGAEDPECSALIIELDTLVKRQVDTDGDVRYARLGEFNRKNPRQYDLPSAEEVRENERPHLDAFRTTCQEIEAWRLRALAKVQAALGNART